MEIKPIHNEKDYEATLARIEEIFDAEPGSDEDQELDLLVALVERYEDRHYPIDPLDPIEFLEATMEARGVGQTELARVLGSRSRASEVLTRKRPLTLAQIRKISKAWNVPAQPLIAEYELSA
jgi:antitoxin component HigA of HigAB toxin-antitoxin module